MTDTVVSSGFTSSGLVETTGNRMIVLSGGASFQTTLSGGDEIVSAGGIASATSVHVGSLQISSGGTAIGTMIVRSRVVFVLLAARPAECHEPAVPTDRELTFVAARWSQPQCSSGGIEFVEGTTSFTILSAWREGTP